MMDDKLVPIVGFLYVLFVLSPGIACYICYLRLGRIEATFDAILEAVKKKDN